MLSKKNQPDKNQMSLEFTDYDKILRCQHLIPCRYGAKCKRCGATLKEIIEIKKRFKK